MKEDSKPSNIACTAFVPHRFKATQCGRCFKSHAQHKQFMKGNNNNHRAYIMELYANQDMPESSSDEDRPSHKNLPSVSNGKVTGNDRNSLLADDESGEITTDYFTPDLMKKGDLRQPLDDADSRPRRQIPKKSAARRTREAGVRHPPGENILQLNIPLDQTPLNDLSLASDANENKESCGFDSVSDNGNENSGNVELLKDLRNNRNFSANQGEKFTSPTDSAGIQYLKAFRASCKSSIPIPKTIREQSLDSKNLQEFQKVAQNLRHVSSPNIDQKAVNGNHYQVVSKSPPVSDSDSSPKLNRQALEERLRTIEAKSSAELSNTAFQTFSGQGKHDTLPRNLGTAVPRPSIMKSDRHQRQSSDPEVFQPAEKEEIQVVSISTRESLSSQDLSPKKQVVTTSKISSEIFFGSSSSNSRQRSPKQMDKSQDMFKAFLDHTEKPVVIVAADGSISHYRGSADAPAESGDLRNNHQERRPAHPKHLAKPYSVVDVSHKPPENLPDFEVPVSPRLPLSPSPRYKSCDGDSNVKLGQSTVPDVVFRFNDSHARFPKRNVALVDGMYAMKDGVRFSQPGFDVTDSTDLKSPLSDGDGDATPPFPILLSESESESSDKRRLSNSSNYKVPIFISPKNYDNVGTVLSDMESSMSDVSKDIPGTSGEGSYGYLTPMRPIKEMNQVDKEPPPVPVRTSSETPFHPPITDEKSAKRAVQSKQKLHPKKPRQPGGQEPNSNNSQSSPESRWRSKTHPLGQEPIYAKVNLGVKKSNLSVSRSNTDAGKTKQKRVAPLPPYGECQEAVYVLPDSLPRSLPPPPPSKEKRCFFEIDNSGASTGRPGKPLAPSPPTEGQLGVIYEAMDRKPTPTKNAANAAASSPTMPQSVSSSGRVQSTPKQGCAATSNIAQPPQGRHSQTTNGRGLSQKLKPNAESKGRNSPPNAVDLAPVSSPTRPMSPPIPCSHLEVIQLPDGSPYQSPSSKETKSKRSKLPWRRRRKRDDRGSPERDFDATVVEKWLEGVHRLKLEEDAQRNSMDRLEVINAYRGEQTAFINHSDLQSPSLSTSPEQNGDDSDGSGIRMRASSSSKRRAPEPPASGRPASWVAGTQVSPDGSTEDIPKLHKCYSLSPRSKRRASDGDTLVQYENTGVLGQRQKKSAPPKPERRQRSMTTGFENLPSHKESNVRPPLLKRQSSSDPDFTATVYELLPSAEAVVSTAASPLKSALKTPGSFETKKAENNAQTQPRRPVRIVAPQKNPEPEKEPTFVNIYSNIEIVQRGLGTSDTRTLATSVVFTANAETQCAWGLPAETEMASASTTGGPDIYESILDINRMALARLAVAAPGRHGIDRGESGTTKPWVDVQQVEDQPCCAVPGGVFYKVVHHERESSVSAIMIGTDPKQASDLLNVAQCSQMVSPHPNVLNICHASIESVPHHMLQPSESQPKGSTKEAAISQAEETVETAVVVTDIAPVTHVGNYTSHNKELHEYLPEKYEHDVALLLLQLLRGLRHLQMHRVCPRSLKLDDLLLADSGLPGGGSLLLINIVTSHLQRDTEQDSPGDIFGSPEQLNEKMAEFDVGLLVYELLHRTNPFATKTSLILQEYEPEHLPSIPRRSRFSQGLCRLAGELLRKKPSERLCTSRAIGMLQCLLWGPPANQIEAAGSPEQALGRWLATEQARKVASMCEYCIPGSDGKATGYSLTDQLQCQFLSDVSIQCLSESMKLLYR